MLTKTPDYIISDCGCPQWRKAANNKITKKHQQQQWPTSQSLATKELNGYNHLATKQKQLTTITANLPFCLQTSSQQSSSMIDEKFSKKLLPLRETLTDYYEKLCRGDGGTKAKSLEASKSDRFELMINSRIDSVDPVQQQKFWKNKQNENRKQKYFNHQQQQQYSNQNAWFEVSSNRSAGRGLTNSNSTKFGNHNQQQRQQQQQQQQLTVERRSRERLMEARHNSYGKRQSSMIRKTLRENHAANDSDSEDF